MSGRTKRACLATIADLRAERNARWDRIFRREDYPRGLALRNYILDGREIIPAPFTEWAQWFERSPHARIVKQDRVRGLFVSTVFLGIDHRFGGDGPPLLFETMIFDERDEGMARQGRDLAQWRWSTYPEAELGHAFAVRLVESGCPFEPTGTG